MFSSFPLWFAAGRAVLEEHMLNLNLYETNCLQLWDILQWIALWIGLSQWSHHSKMFSTPWSNKTGMLTKKTGVWKLDTFRKKAEEKDEISWWEQALSGNKWLAFCWSNLCWSLIMVCNLPVSGINRSILGLEEWQQLESYNCRDL